MDPLRADAMNEHEYDDEGTEYQRKGFITTGFRPVFPPTGFIALFGNRWKMGLKTSGRGFLGGFWFQVFLPFLSIT